MDRVDLSSHQRSQCRAIIVKAQIGGAYDISKPPGLVQQSRDIPLSALSL